MVADLARGSDLNPATVSMDIAVDSSVFLYGDVALHSKGLFPPLLRLFRPDDAKKCRTGQSQAMKRKESGSFAGVEIRPGDMTDDLAEDGFVEPVELVMRAILTNHISCRCSLGNVLVSRGVGGEG